jgi:starch-binding outer membrane protein, SusD/RagB family
MIIKVKYFLIILLVFSQFSCNDWLDLLPPSGLIREEFWQAKEDVEAVLMASYESFANLDYELFLYGELRGDLLEGDNNQNQSEQNIMESNIYPDNNLCNWKDFYNVINSCNEVIKNAPEVLEVDNTFNEFQMNVWISEAYFMRSLTFFYLVRVFKDIPFVVEPSESDNVDFFLPKSTEEEVLNQIVSDLEANREFAPSGGFPTIGENKGRASKAAFDALLADIELWRFNYEKALTHIKKIEQNEQYELLPGSKWFEIFYPGNSLEGIFEIQYDGQLNQNNSTYNLTRESSNQYLASQTAIEMFGLDYSVEIIRGQGATIAKVGQDEFVIWKYVGQSPDGLTSRSGDEQNSCNWIVYRLADVLLMKAEALCQLERFQEALVPLNIIRERANLLPLNLPESKVAFEDAILQERALELAYEGKRWFDLLRMGRRDGFARKNKLIEIIVSNAVSTQKRVLAAKLTNPLGWYLPVFDEEIERNKNLVQNPYYDF